MNTRSTNRRSPQNTSQASLRASSGLAEAQAQPHQEASSTRGQPPSASTMTAEAAPKKARSGHESAVAISPEIRSGSVAESASTAETAPKKARSGREPAVAISSEIRSGVADKATLTAVTAPKKARSGQTKSRKDAVASSLEERSILVAAETTSQGVRSGDKTAETVSSETRSGFSASSEPRPGSKDKGTDAVASSSEERSIRVAAVTTSKEVRSGNKTAETVSSETRSGFSASSPQEQSDSDSMSHIRQDLNLLSDDDSDVEMVDVANDVSRGSVPGHLGSETPMTLEEVLFRDSLVIGDPATGVVVSSLKPLLDLSLRDLEKLLPSRAIAGFRAVYATLTNTQAALERRNLQQVLPDLPAAMTSGNPIGATDTLVVVWSDIRLSTIPSHLWRRLIAPLFSYPIEKECANPVVRLSDVMQAMGERVLASATQAAGMIALSIMPVAIIADLCDALGSASRESLEILMAGRKDLVGSMKIADQAADISRQLLSEQAGLSQIVSSSKLLERARDFLASIVPIRMGLPILTAMTNAFRQSYALMGHKGYDLPYQPEGTTPEEFRGRYPFKHVPRAKRDVEDRECDSRHTRGYAMLIRNAILPKMWEGENVPSRLSEERRQRLVDRKDVGPLFFRGVRIAAALYTERQIGSGERLKEAWPVLLNIDSQWGLFGGRLYLDRKTVAARFRVPEMGGSRDPQGDLRRLGLDGRFYGFFLALIRTERAQLLSRLSFGMDEFVEWVAAGALLPFNPRSKQSSMTATSDSRSRAMEKTSTAEAALGRASSGPRVAEARSGDHRSAAEAAFAPRSVCSPMAATSDASRRATGKTSTAEAALEQARSGPRTTEARSGDQRSTAEAASIRVRSDSSTSRSHWSQQRPRSRSRGRRSRSRSRQSNRSSARRSRRSRSRSRQSTRSSARRSRSRSRQSIRSSARRSPEPSPLPTAVSLLRTTPAGPPHPSPAPSAPSPLASSDPVAADLLEKIRSLEEMVKTSLLQKKRKREDSLEDAATPLPSDEDSDSSGDDLVPQSDSEYSDVDAEEEEPRLSRAPPPLPPQLLEELTLGRVGAFVAEDLRTRLYAKKWKVPASTLVAAKDLPSPKDQQWNLPGKESLLADQVTDLFNKAEGVVTHSRPNLSFGSETVAAKLKESPLLSKEEKDFLKTGLEKEQTRDHALLWRAVRTHQEALLTEAKVEETSGILALIQRNHPDWWSKIREEVKTEFSEDLSSQMGSTLPAQQAVRMREMTGNTVALFMETLKQGYRRAYLLAAKALGVHAQTLGTSLPLYDVTICPPTMVAEAQAQAALPHFGTLPRQRGGAQNRRGKGRRVPAATRKARRAGHQSNTPRAQPPADRSPPKSGGPRKDGKPSAPKKKAGGKGGNQKKKQKRE